MKIALITDQHFGARNDSQLFLDYYEQFYSEVFFPKLLEENVKCLLRSEEHTSELQSH